jgi:predicted  nucleic acid-binding Zn-ribbon protein
MTNVKALRELQEIEQERATIRSRLVELKEKQGESPALLSARAAAESAAQRLRTGEKAQKEREYEFETVSKKLAASQNRLYSGTVKNPKELQGLEEEVKHLTGRTGQLQDEILESLIEVEEAGEALVTADASLREIESEWRAEQVVIKGEIRGHSKCLTTLDAAGSALQGRLTKADIELYVDLRRRKGPTPIALVTGGNCEGCGVRLSVTQKRQVQNDDELIFCSSCGRLLTTK